MSINMVVFLRPNDGLANYPGCILPHTMTAGDNTSSPVMWKGIKGKEKWTSEWMCCASWIM